MFHCRLLVACCLFFLSLTTTLSAMAEEASPNRTEALGKRIERLEAIITVLTDELDGRRDRWAPGSLAEIDFYRAEAEVSDRLEQMEHNLQQVRQRVSVAVEELESVSQFFERQREPGFSMGDTQITFGGYVKFDTIVSRYSDGAPPSSSAGRDFYVPSTVAASFNGARETVLDFSPRESRFLFKTETPLGDDTLGSHLELDFLVTDNDNEIVSNSFTPRLRQAYLTYRNFLFGQAWSTFLNVAAIPENLDFVGPTEAVVFARQPMVRYTRGPFEIAIENPETTITARDGSRLVPDADRLPDLTARYTFTTRAGEIKLAGLLRQLRTDGATLLAGGGTAITPDDNRTAIGYGLSLSGRLKLNTRDDLRFMANYGDGGGRYFAVALIDGAAIGPDGDLDTIEAYSGYLSYRHFWAPRWRSNFTVGYFRANNPTLLTGFTPTDQVFSGHINLLYSPVNRLTVGAEVIFARRRLEVGSQGDLNRLQFSARYGF
ncbi:MAG: DcaP family trimeric outer membrane transporter [Rhodothalassiaceae bacterium]